MVDEEHSRDRRSTHAAVTVAKVGLALCRLVAACLLASPAPAVTLAKVGLLSRSLVAAWFLAPLAPAVTLADVASRRLVAA